MGMRRGSDAVKRLVGLGVLAALAIALFGFIDPRFTPLQLVRQSTQIVAGTVQAGEGGGWRIADPAAIQGRVPATLALTCAGEHADQVRALLAQGIGRPAILFADAARDDGRCLLSIDGVWLQVRAVPGGWSCLAPDQKLSGTFAGGTDMLIRLARYIVADPDATVPVGVGTSWMECSRIDRLTAVAGLAAVAVEGGDAPCLFVAAPDGDRLYRPVADEERLEDISAKVHLGSRSRRFAWHDLDGNGSADLVTFDGEGLSVRLASPVGFVDQGRLEWNAADGQCLGLAPAGPGRILVSSGRKPFLLAWQAGAWQRSELPAPGADAPAGPASACIVADLDGDGLVDALQPLGDGGLLWRGTPAGFQAPVRSAVASPAGDVRAALGDFDGDGHLDLCLGDAGHLRLWEDDGHGAFADATAHAGSLSYKAKPAVTCCVAADLNHDGRQDLILGYGDAGFSYHFNRGFRCFGEEGGLHLDEVRDPPAEAGLGITACTVADFDGNGADDAVVAFSDGSVFCYYNNLFDAAVIRARLAPGVAGPVTVTLWEAGKGGACVGASVVAAPGRYLGLRKPGAYEARWHGADGRERIRQLNVAGPVDLVLGEEP
jgi:hypothetical protein